MAGSSEGRKKYTVIENTATYKLFKGIGHFKAGSIVTVIVIVACVALGFACVMRYASVFDLTRHTRALEKENEKLRNKISVEADSLEIGETAGADSIAAKLGMVRPSGESVISIPVRDGDVTRVYLAADETGEDEADGGFYRSLLVFLGRVNYDD